MSASHSLVNFEEVHQRCLKIGEDAHRDQDFNREHECDWLQNQLMQYIAESHKNSQSNVKLMNIRLSLIIKNSLYKQIIIKIKREKVKVQLDILAKLEREVPQRVYPNSEHFRQLRNMEFLLKSYQYGISKPYLTDNIEYKSEEEKNAMVLKQMQEQEESVKSIAGERKLLEMCNSLLHEVGNVLESDDNISLKHPHRIYNFDNIQEKFFLIKQKFWDSCENRNQFLLLKLGIFKLLTARPPVSQLQVEALVTPKLAA
jgi:hypothetical protein